MLICSMVMLNTTMDFNEDMQLPVSDDNIKAGFVYAGAYSYLLINNCTFFNASGKLANALYGSESFIYIINHSYFLNFED